MLCFGECIDLAQGVLSRTQLIDCSFAETTGHLGHDTAVATARSVKGKTVPESSAVCNGHLVIYQDSHSSSETSTSSEDGQADQKHALQAAPSLAPTAAAPQTAAAAATPAAVPAVLYPYIVQHGRGILSLSTLQEGLQHFVVPGVGYIAYALMYNGPEILNIQTPVALGDPVCDETHYDIMASSFLDKHPRAMFMQIGAGFARVLRSHGLLVNSLGGETHMNLVTYTFSGYAKRGLRSAIASAAKEGITVEEVMRAPITAEAVIAAAAATSNGSSAGALPSTAAAAGQWDSLAAEMQEVDNEWLSRKGRHAGRVWFLNRQPVFAPEPGVRKLTARDCAGHLLGFIFFDAVYEGGQLAGYYANVTRMRPDAHPGVLNLVVKEFVDRVRNESQLAVPNKKLSLKKSLKNKLQHQQQQQDQPDANSASSTTSNTAAAGVCRLSLGMSPLYQLDDSIFKHSKRVRMLFEMSFRQGSGYYPFKPLAAAKAKYGAGLHNGTYEDPAVTYQQVYLAHSHHRLVAVALFDLGKFLGFWEHPADAARSFLGYKLKQGLQAVGRKVNKRKEQHKNSSASSGSSCSSGGGGSGAVRCGVITTSSREVAPEKYSSNGAVSSSSSSAGFPLGSSSTKQQSCCNSASSSNSSVPALSVSSIASVVAGSRSTSSRMGKCKLPLVHPIIPPRQASRIGHSSAVAAASSTASAASVLAAAEL